MYITPYITPEHGEHVVAHKLLAQVLHEDLLDAHHLSLLARRLQLLTLPRVICVCVIILRQVFELSSHRSHSCNQRGDESGCQRSAGQLRSLRIIAAAITDWYELVGRWARTPTPYSGSFCCSCRDEVMY